MSNATTILLHSPQGGSGKSTIAVNLAIHYAKLNFRVLLLDLAGYGGVPAMMKIPIRGKGISSLITYMEQHEDFFQHDEFSEHFKNALIVMEEYKNLHIMLGASPLKMEKLSLKHTNTLIQSAKDENYDLILIDTSSEICERNIAAIEQADFILVPMIQDVGSGWKVILFKEIMENLNVPREQVGLIVNRCTKYSGFNNDEFQTEIGYAIVSEIADLSRWMIRYTNQGIPIVDSGKKKASVPFQKLATSIIKKAGME